MEEKTRLKKTLAWFENKKIIVVLAIILIVYFTVAKILKSTSDIRNSVKDLSQSPKTEIITEIDDLSTKESVQTIQLVGKVLDDKNNPVSNAKVEVVGLTGEDDFTDASGNFLLHSTYSENRGELELMVSKKHYQSLIQKIETFSDSEVNLGRLYLSKVSIPKENKKKEPASYSSKEKEGSNVEFKENTFNGAVINNPTGPIEINSTINTRPDTINNE
ncbi:MAG: carboxypeptidase-like regulatory domain-containing protein [bacterium]|nr:carboxypeptidase-like regulatory domain-containing protein [bacterium]